MNEKWIKYLEATATETQERERQVIGAAFLDFAEVARTRRAGLTSAMFRDPVYRTAFEIMEEADDRSETIDIVGVNARVIALSRGIEPEAVTDHLMKAADAVPSGAHSIDAAAAICRADDRRRIKEAAAAAEIMAVNPAADDPLPTLERAVSEIHERRSARGLTSRVDLSTSLLRIMENAVNPKKSRLFETGAEGFDHATGGLTPGALVILAARPSVGKTTYAMHLARTIAKGGTDVGVVSLEMGGDSIVSLLLSAESGVEHERIRKGRCTDDDLKRMEEARGNLTIENRAGVFGRPRPTGRLILDAPNGANLSTVRSIVSEMVRGKGARVVLVDYLQLIGGPEEKEYERVSNASRAMKALAQTLDVPLIVLAQLNRDQAREDRPPKLCDLRGSGAIEQDADVVVFLHRPTDLDRSVVEVRCEKNREGSVGTVTYRTDYARRRFEEPPYFGEHAERFREGADDAFPGSKPQEREAEA